MTVSADVSDWERYRARAKTADRPVAAAQRKVFRDFARDVGRELAEEGSQGMPAGGGLQQRLAGTKVSVRQLNAGLVVILGGPGSAIGRINASGVVRHPTYGNRSVWGSTQVEPGTWTAAAEKRRDDVAERIGSELGRVLREELG